MPVRFSGCDFVACVVFFVVECRLRSGHLVKPLYACLVRNRKGPARRVFPSVNRFLCQLKSALPAPTNNQFLVAAIMSSLIDAVINSDRLGSEADPRKKDVAQSVNGQRRQQSSRAQPPPSESNGHLSDAEGFADDEVVGGRGTVRDRPRNPMDRAIA